MLCEVSDWETVQQIVERLAVIAGAVLRAVSAGAHQASGAAVDTVAGVAQVVALVAEVAAAVVVAVAVVVAADSNSRKGKAMSKSNWTGLKCSTLFTASLFVFCLLFTGGLTCAKAQTTNTGRGTGFTTAQEAVDALVAAAEKYDEKTLSAILGPNSYDIIHTGEPVRDKEMAAEFATQVRTKQSLTKDTRQRGRMILNVGTDDWPFPIPIVNLGGKWYFDTTVGRDEILLRRIGRNELDAIEICRGFVEAQYEYVLAKSGEPGVTQYAQRIISTPGKQDGLAWQNSDGTWDGPIGENVAKAIARGYTSRNEPYRGYFFQVLKGQGPAAPLGKMDFVVNGVMIGGFALIAVPAQYRNTGVKTFMVSHDGVVYEKDLGPNTLEIARGIEFFNPDNTWTPVLEQ